MNYLSTMSEEDIRYICSVIPKAHSLQYFKKNPKKFNEVMPGYRPISPSLNSEEKISKILFQKRSQPFISSFIEEHISRWLDEVDEAIKHKIDAGVSGESALLHALSHCSFAGNIEIYFRLKGEEHAKDYLLLLSESIKTIKEILKKSEQVNSDMEAKKIAVSRLERELKLAHEGLTRSNQKLSEHMSDIQALKQVIANLEKSNSRLATLEQIIISHEEKAREREEYIQQLKKDLSFAKDEQQQLEQKIREEIAKQAEIAQNKHRTAQRPKRPKDIEEFKEYLGYNFESIGVPTATEYFSLLKDHLSDILFQGKPIIIGKITATSLMKCIANALIEDPDVPTLSFSVECTDKLIDGFLSQDKRVLCLDNFIGNYDETTLIAICDRHKDKIIILTVMYDHTLAYVPDEMLIYCHYLNLNRISAFSETKKLSEDPSAVDEEEVEACVVVPDVRWSTILQEIFGELDIHGALPVYKSFHVTDESSLCRLLAFDVLPYCVDIRRIEPFNISARLLKYAGTNGRCQYKELFKTWFK